MRLIDADAIPYAMLYKENFLAGTGHEAQAVWKEDIDAMPTIEERKSGKWIEDRVIPDAYDITGEETWASEMRCDNCGFTMFAIEGHMGQYNYCPNCGAMITYMIPFGDQDDT